ncbi:MAG: Fic family protein, partial [Bacillota bacterium]|nr:Fic family protein [Bacillota bacterium]
VFAWLPIEELIRERQDAYYAALAQADAAGDATLFIEFLMAVIHDTLNEISRTQFEEFSEDSSVHVRRLLEKMEGDTLSALQIMERLGLKNRASFRKRYLVPALEQKLIEMEYPDKPNSSKQRYRKK